MWWSILNLCWVSTACQILPAGRYCSSLCLCYTTHAGAERNNREFFDEGWRKVKKAKYKLLVMMHNKHYHRNLLLLSNRQMHQKKKSNASATSGWKPCWPSVARSYRKGYGFIWSTNLPDNWQCTRARDEKGGRPVNKTAKIGQHVLEKPVCS